VSFLSSSFVLLASQVEMDTGSLSPFGCFYCQTTFLILQYNINVPIKLSEANTNKMRAIAIRYQKTISWSMTKYSKNYPVNVTAQIEQVQDKKKQ
jgi:hypothetical protein